MKSKQIIDFVVERNQSLGCDFARLVLQADCKLPEITSGQFVQVQIPSSIHGWLRIPISIHFVDAPKRQVWLLVQRVGKGSFYIAGLREGERINLILPLGHGFSLPEESEDECLLVGGGCGLAPLYSLGTALKDKQIPFRFLVGAKNRERLVLTEELSLLAPTDTCTEDGSCGFKGLVTEHPLWQKKFSRIYTCGPTPMMKAVARLATQKNAVCEVSLENTMACGIGACLCCVTPDAEGHHRCVCTDGPVFNSKVLGW